MGSSCSKDSDDDADISMPIVTQKDPEEAIVETTGPLKEWEILQNKIHEPFKLKLIEDFENRPDNFITSLLMLSIQFFECYEIEKNTINKLTRSMESELNEVLLTSERKVLFMGSTAIISGKHLLYRQQLQNELLLPSPVQYFIDRDNVELFRLDPDQELHPYNTVDGPPYRFIVEPSVNHPCYVRLRCADIIPDDNRNSTYEDLYVQHEPFSSDLPDPYVDKIPLRSSISKDIPEPSRGFNSRFEEGMIEKLNSSSVQKKKDSREIPINRLTERRPSGIMPGMNFNLMNKDRSMNRFIPDKKSALARALAVITESDEEDESEVEDSDGNDQHIQGYETDCESPAESERVSTRSNSVTALSTYIESECFITKTIKIKRKDDVFGVNDLKQKRCYFSSKRYMETCVEDFSTLTELIDEDSLSDNFQVQGPAICCSYYKPTKTSDMEIMKEFIPSLTYKEWPECAQSWVTRVREPKWDEELKILYRWPSQNIIEEVVNGGCNVVPFGFYNPKGMSMVMGIEWQCQFIRAEQRLLRSLGHNQIKLLLMVELLLRDHVKVDSILKSQHLRYILFWMCEDDYKEWQDGMLGIKLKKFFKILYNSLAREDLPHYFVDNYNMFEVIPLRHIRTLQESVKRIYENLPICMLHTFNRTAFNRKFYPKVDIVEIYKLITIKQYGLEQVVPQLAAPQPKQEEERHDSDSDEDMDEVDRQTRIMLHEQRKAKEKTENIEVRQERKSVIDISNKVQILHKDQRTLPLLETFIKHFIKMAEYSSKFRAYTQFYMYILVTKYIADMIEDEANDKTTADQYRKQADQLYVNSRGGVEEMIGPAGEKDSYSPYESRHQSSVKKLKEPLPQTPQNDQASTSNFSFKKRTPVSEEKKKMIDKSKNEKALLKNFDDLRKKSESREDTKSKLTVIADVHGDSNKIKPQTASTSEYLTNSNRAKQHKESISASSAEGNQIKPKESTSSSLDDGNKIKPSVSSLTNTNPINLQNLDESISSNLADRNNVKKQKESTSSSLSDNNTIKPQTELTPETIADDTTGKVDTKESSTIFDTVDKIPNNSSDFNKSNIIPTENSSPSKYSTKSSSLELAENSPKPKNDSENSTFKQGQTTNIVSKEKENLDLSKSLPSTNLEDSEMKTAELITESIYSFENSGYDCSTDL